MPTSIVLCVVKLSHLERFARNVIGKNIIPGLSMLLCRKLLRIARCGFWKKMMMNKIERFLSEALSLRWRVIRIVLRNVAMHSCAAQ